MRLTPRAPIGWWLLVGSLLVNVFLLASIAMMRYDMKKSATKDQAMLFALDRCQQNLARYAEVKALADAYDKMVEERR